jgi:orotidine-5'-phosphate decarboxylase
MDEQIFLDLKFHDIPNTVAAAGVEATRLGVSIFNVHAVGGSEMMRRTAEAVAMESESAGISKPAIIAVTVLTSSIEDTLKEVGLVGKPDDAVKRLALLSEFSGLDGVVASPREIGTIRATIQSPEFLIVTPGIRPSGAALNDQKRVTTPGEAIHAGASYLVVGRPILKSDDITRAAQTIIDEMENVNAHDTSSSGRN